jgi:probable phosphomutase (TIGR03848 family)
MPRRKAPSRPPTVAVLVRHGLTPTTGRVLPGRAGGLHLSDAGREQAEAAAARIAALDRVEAVYASPLARARETAAPIAGRLGLAVRVERGLQECDYGRWTGAELKNLSKLPEWRAVQAWPSGFRFPGGESLKEMQARVVETIWGLHERHPGATVVAVSHADPIKAAVADALGTHLDLFQRIVISPCSITTIQLSADGPTVLGVNSVAGAVAEKVS